MNQHKIKYLLIIALFIIGCSSERDKIESKTYSFSTSFTTPLLLKTLERIDIKLEVYWNICKPQIFWSIYEDFSESTIKNEIYMGIMRRARAESSLHKNNDFLIQDPTAINIIKETSQLEINEFGVCIKKLQITRT